MRFTPVPIAGACLVHPQPRRDDRGSFSRLWCRDEFAAQGLSTSFVQCNSSFSEKRGTLRGLHRQAAPYEEIKLIRCVRGAVFDVIVDLRPRSSTYAQWFGAELSEQNQTLLYVPEGCAHGYLTLEDQTEVEYPVTAPYQPGAEQGVRWNDPRFAITWPLVEQLTISPKDEAWPDFVE